MNGAQDQQYAMLQQANATLPEHETAALRERLRKARTRIAVLEELLVMALSRKP